MAGVAQSVERQIVALEAASSKLVARPTFFEAYAQALGCRQAVRHGILIPAFVGSNPATPAKNKSGFKRLFRTANKFVRHASAKFYGPLAQLAEHLTFNQGVPGSSLGWTTKPPQASGAYAALAQLVEQLTLNQWAQGSSP